MSLPCTLIKLVKAVGYYFSSSSVVHFYQTVTFSSMSRDMLMGYYSSLVANHTVYILHVALWACPGTSQGGYRRAHSLEFLAEAGGEQMAPDDIWAVCRRC